MKGFDSKTKWMSFLIEDDEMLKTCNDIWNKASNNSSKKKLVPNPSTVKNF